MADKLTLMNNTIVTLFGGTGFIGEQIVRECARAGFIIRLAETHPKKAETVKFNASHVGQIVGVQCDMSQKGIEDVIKDSHIVINCIGILAEGGHRTFMQTHCYLPEYMAKACAKHNVQHFVHISALGIDYNKSHYAKSKLAGEQVIHKNFDKVTILRPSVVFGPKDSFFNMFASMAQILPVLPLIGGGKTLFQPVYVGDVAEAAIKALPEEANSHYRHAFALGRYSQGLSITKALKEGIAGKVRASLQTALELAPKHAEAHTAMALYHAEIISKIGSMIGGLTYGAKAADAEKHIKEALKLTPASPIALVEYGNVLMLLHGDKKEDEAAAAYEKAAGSKPLDAMEALDAAYARSEIE